MEREERGEGNGRRGEREERGGVRERGEGGEGRGEGERELPPTKQCVLWARTGTAGAGLKLLQRKMKTCPRENMNYLFALQRFPQLNRKRWS